MMPKLKLQTYHLRYPILPRQYSPISVEDRKYYDLRHLNQMLKVSIDLNASDSTDLYDVNIDASVAL